MDEEIRDGIDKRMGSTGPDMEEKMVEILSAISSLAMPYYENASFLERGRQRSPYTAPSINPLHIPFPVDSASSEAAIGSQSFSK